MNFSELRQELFARGTDYLDEDADGQARADRWLNDAYRQILNLQPWPFLVSTATGVSGSGEVTVSDLRRAIHVADSDVGTVPGRELEKITYMELVRLGYDVSQTGTPVYYYIERTDGSGGATFKTFPVGGTPVVRYLRRVQPLSGTDTPVFDEEYHNLIVDGAMLPAYRDGDNFEAAAALQASYDAALASMAEDYMLDSTSTSYIEVVDPMDG